MNLTIRQRLLSGSALIMVLLITLTVTAILQIRTLSQILNQTNHAGSAAAAARALSLYTQYNAADSSAYVIGRREYRQVFDAHAERFAAAAARLRADLSQIDGSAVRVTDLDAIMERRAAYDQATIRLFEATDARRSAAQELRNLQLTGSFSTGEITVESLQQQVAALNAASATLANRQKEENDAWLAAVALSDDIDVRSQELFRGLDELSQSGSATAQQTVRQTVWILGGLGLVSLGLIVVMQGSTIRALGTPLNRLLLTARRLGEGDLAARAELQRRDELGVLGATFDTMACQLAADRAKLVERSGDLEHALAEGQQLFATVQALSTPVLPILDNVVVLPLVGHIDSQRGEAISMALLEGIDRYRAHTAILDLTGVALADTYVLNLLLRASQGARLLGARVIIVGISAEAAQIIVQQEINLSGIETHATLHGALTQVFALEQQHPNQHLLN